MPALFCLQTKDVLKGAENISEKKGESIMEGLFEKFYNSGAPLLNTGFYKKMNEFDLKEAQTDIDGSRARLKLLLANDEPLKEEKADALLEELCHAHEWHSRIESFDSFVCGWRMATRLFFESLIL